ncbi:MAG TPA: penicillin acylase family protein [Bacillota bacterium]
MALSRLDRRRRPPPRRWLRWLVAALAVVVGVVAAAAYSLLSRPLPQLDGEVAVAGLQAPVTVIRDDVGVPHVRADNLHDLFFAHGYVQAQDRLWQMDVTRRLASGRLAEIVGEAALDADRLFRTVGLHRAAEAEWALVEGDARRALLAFTEGVNAYMETHADRLPLEFRVLGYRPEPWAPVDSLAIGYYMAWYLGGNMTEELFNAAALSRLELPLASDLIARPELPGPTITGPPVAQASRQSARGRAAPMGSGTAGRLLTWLVDTDLLPDRHAGSNNWVVAPRFSESGRPLLANDPHLGVGLPAIWHQIHLQAPGYHAVGVSFPGAPGVIVGHNERIAWGVTNLGADVQDLYIEVPHPDDPHRFLYEGAYEPAQVVREEIRVRGRAEPVVLDVVITRHGPVISDVIGSEVGAAAPDYPLALRWTALEQHHIYETFFDVATAGDWESFRRAVAPFSAPGQNFVYADVEGNIGYAATGLVPIRAAGDGQAPVPGWLGAYEWTGYVPFEEMPALHNPLRGVIWTANNRPAGLDYPHYLGASFALPYRAQRIGEALLGPEGALLPAEAAASPVEPLGVDDMARLQSDVYNVQARDLVPLLERALAQVEARAGTAGVDPTLAAEAARLLRVWAREPFEAPDAAGPLIYHTFFECLLERTFRQRMGEEFYRTFLEVGEPTGVLDRLIRFKPDSRWFDDPASPERETLEDAVTGAFVAAVARLVAAHGSDPQQWRWADAHTITFEHPLAVVPPLGRLLNIGPLPLGGSGLTPQAASFGWGDNGRYSVGSAGIWRQVVDVGNWDASVDVVAPGQSGHRVSAHYADQAELWLEGRHHPQHFSSEAVDAAAVHRLRLVPAE